MGITELTAAAIIIYLFYLLFVKGIIWPILLSVICIGGGRMLIEKWLPATNATVATFLNYNIPLSVFIACLITLMGFAVILGKDE